MSQSRPLILASASPYRRALLARLGLPFENRPADVDESPRDDETPSVLVRRLAAAKAHAAGADGPALLIGSDQVAELDGEVLGKPGGRDSAIEQLRRQAGKSVDFHAGVCLLDAADGSERVDVVTVRVRFRPLESAEIRRYVDAERPFDCAGSFKSEALGITLCEAIESNDPTALIGLPLIRLSQMLREAGVELP